MHASVSGSLPSDGWLNANSVPVEAPRQALQRLYQLAHQLQLSQLQQPQHMGQQTLPFPQALAYTGQYPYQLPPTFPMPCKGPYAVPTGPALPPIHMDSARTLSSELDRSDTTHLQPLATPASNIYDTPQWALESACHSKHECHSTQLCVAPATSTPRVSTGSLQGGSPGVQWAHRLCNTTFFQTCKLHDNHKYRRNECTFFCLDCEDSGALCSSCTHEHASCRLLQIRRYVYRDVVKVADIKQHIDPAGIQTYTVNHAQAVFISAKDKAVVGPYYRVDSTSSCLSCNRGLRDGCKFCSLACKLAATEGSSTAINGSEKFVSQNGESDGSQCPVDHAQACPKGRAASKPAVRAASQCLTAAPAKAPLMPSSHSACGGLYKRSRDGELRSAFADDNIRSRRKQLRPTRAME